MKKLIIILAAMLLLLCGCSQGTDYEKEFREAKAKLVEINDLAYMIRKEAETALHEGKYTSGEEKIGVYTGAMDEIITLCYEVDEKTIAYCGY